MSTKNLTFELDEVETQRAREWMKEHSEICPVSFKNGNMPAAGEHYYFKFLPTGLGTCTTVGCIYCKVSKDITNIDNW